MSRFKDHCTYRRETDKFQCTREEGHEGSHHFGPYIYSEFARGAIRARIRDSLGYKVVRIEGPVNIINKRKGIELSPETVTALAYWLRGHAL